MSFGGRSSVSAYCQQLKDIYNQLSNVDEKVFDHEMVFQLVVGFSKEFDMVASLIQQSKPLPSFAKACSMVLLEETCRAQQQSLASDAKALVASSTRSSGANVDKPPPPKENANNRGGAVMDQDVAEEEIEVVVVETKC